MPLISPSASIIFHCVKSVRIRSFSGPYSVQMREKTNQKNSEYGHFSRSGLSDIFLNRCAEYQNTRKNLFLRVSDWKFLVNIFIFISTLFNAKSLSFLVTMLSPIKIKLLPITKVQNGLLKSKFKHHKCYPDKLGKNNQYFPVLFAYFSILLMNFIF